MFTSSRTRKVFCGLPIYPTFLFQAFRFTTGLMLVHGHGLENSAITRALLPSLRSTLLLRVPLYSREAGESSEKPEPTMEKEDEKEKGAFYVVRKGDVVGIYRSLDDRQAQVGSSMWDPPVSVFKGHRFPETEEYLISRGLKDAIFTIRAKDMKDGLFGLLVQCAFLVEKVPTSLRGVISSEKRSQQRFCILKFDGAEAGAEAVLLADDGCVICKLREGLCEATDNEADYRVLLLGLKHAYKKALMESLS